SFRNHALGIGRKHLGTDRAWHAGADRLQRLDIVEAGFGREGRIRRDTVYKAGFSELGDFAGIGTVNEELHDDLYGVDPIESPYELYRMKPAAVRPVDELLWQPAPRAGVLLPLPLSGAYDYKLPKGTLVS